jgi:hypothetical protein
MKTLVTDGAGFIGSNPAGQLLKDGHSITILDAAAEGSGAIFHLAALVPIDDAQTNVPGPAIHEALSTGCPGMLSDRAHWRGLEAAVAGWDIRAAWNDSEFRTASASAREFVRNFMARQNLLGDYRATLADSRTVAGNSCS